MEKVHLIGWALLAILFTASAVSITVNSVQEGKAALGTSTQLEEVGCKIYSITKTGTTSQELDEDWVVSYAMEYTIDGIQSRDGVGQTTVKTNTEQAVKTAVEPLCEAIWAEAQTKFGTIDSVMVKTTVNENPVLEQIYSAVGNSWSNITAQQP